MKAYYFIKFLTLQRILNAFKIYVSYYFSRLFKSPVLWGSPLSISIEPSAICNLHCPECPAGKGILTRNTGLLTNENFIKYLSSFEKNLIYLTLYFQGEPFLNKEFFKMVEHAKSKKLFVLTSTNAHYLSEENCEKIIKSSLDQIVISLDGSDSETYCRYRVGGDFNKVISGINNLVETKKKFKSKTPFIQLQFLVFSYNEDQMDEIIKLAGKFGISDVQFKSAQIYDLKNSKDMLPLNMKYSRYKINSDGSVVLKKRIKNRCRRMWTSLVVTWQGDVVPCCFDKDAEFVFGNLNVSSIKEIRKSEKYEGFRKQIFLNRKKIPICTNCTE